MSGGSNIIKAISAYLRLQRYSRPPSVIKVGGFRQIVEPSLIQEPDTIPPALLKSVSNMNDKYAQFPFSSWHPELNIYISILPEQNPPVFWMKHCHGVKF